VGEDEDIRWKLERGEAIEEIADFLCRTVSEVRHASRNTCPRLSRRERWPACPTKTFPGLGLWPGSNGKHRRLFQSQQKRSNLRTAATGFAKIPGELVRRSISGHCRAQPDRVLL